MVDSGLANQGGWLTSIMAGYDSRTINARGQHADPSSRQVQDERTQYSRTKHEADELSRRDVRGSCRAAAKQGDVAESCGKH